MKKMSESSVEYRHRVSYSNAERWVGFFVLAGFVLFLFFIFISVRNQHLFEDHVVFYIEVNSSEGIRHGSTVNVLGTEVGSVLSLKRTEGQKIRVALGVYEGQQQLIRTGAKVVINRLTNIGNALIEIKSDAFDAPVLPDGSTLTVEETPSLNDLLLGLANLVQSAGNHNLLGKFELMLPKLEQTLENMHQIISQIASGHGTLGAAVFDQQVEQELKIVVKSGAELLTEAEGIISVAKQRLDQLEPVLQNADSMTHDLSGVSKNLPEVVAQLTEIMAQVKTALTLVNAELQDIPGVATEARRSLNKADRLLDSVQQLWPLSSEDESPQQPQLIPVQSVHD